jgi:type 1 fimbria pilin
MNRSHPFHAVKATRRSLGLAVTVFALSFGAQAECVVTPGYIEKTVNMSMGRVYIPNDLPVGGLIRSQRFPLTFTGNDKPWNCLPSGGLVKGVMLQGTAVPGYDHVFTTDVPGVGIRLSRYFSASSVAYYPHDLSTTSDFGPFDPGSSFQVELFKVAARTGSGPFAQGTYTRYFSTGSDQRSVLTTFLLGEGITIITPTCSVDAGSRNILVDFGKVAKGDFRGKGSTAAERKFSIKLNCQSGLGVQNMVLLRMDAVQDPSNEPGVLRITPSGTVLTAEGVGIQIVDDKQMPVKFGDDAEVGPSKDGSYIVPFTARYYQTGDKIGAGRADGTATFTIMYR